MNQESEERYGKKIKAVDQPQRVNQLLNGDDFDTNLKRAVKKIVRGHQREETERFMAFRSHWGFESEFCDSARGNEKGGVKGEQGEVRGNYLMPPPEARDLEHLNELLLAAAKEEEQRIIAGRAQSMGAAMAVERGHLRSLAWTGSIWRRRFRWSTAAAVSVS